MFRQPNSSLHAYLSIAMLSELHQLALDLSHLHALQKEPMDAARTMDTSQKLLKGVEMEEDYRLHPDTLRMTDS